MFHWLGLAHQDMGDDERGAGRIGPAVALQVGELCNQQGGGNDDERIGEDEIFLLQSARHAERVHASIGEHEDRHL